MKNFISKQIRNVVLLGHGASGKSSLAKAMLLQSQAKEYPSTLNLGSVFDSDPEEIRRKISIYASTAPVFYNGSKINIIDTPGQPDFEGEMLEGLCAADCAVITVSGKSGIHVGTEKAWARAKAQKLPTAFFVGKLDDENADYFRTLEALKAKFGAIVCPITVPFDEGNERIFVNIPHMRAFKYKNGKVAEVPVPETGHRIKGLVAAISEAIAETNEEYFDKFFSGEEFTKEEFSKGILDGIKQGIIAPVFCGSALDGSGIDMFLDGIVSYFPSPQQEEPNDVSALVFKTVADPYVGKLSYLKVLSGEIRSDSVLYNTRTEKAEKVGKLYIMCGKKQIETTSISAGDIGAAAKMVSPLTGDTLSSSPNAKSLENIVFPNPCYSMAVSPISKGDENKIAVGLRRLCEEDPTIRFETQLETKEQILSGLGDLHIEVTIGKLKAKFGVGVALRVPEVAYRETIKKTVTAEGKHKKQTGGHGQYGHVVIRFEPCDSEELIFEQAVVGGSVPKNYFPAVEKGLRECVLHGAAAGFPVVNLKATLLDGSYHPVDSSEMAFKLAAALAYKNAMPQAQSVLLEPIGRLRANIPQDICGDVIGDINKRRGKVFGMDHSEDGNEIIEADVPVREMHDFCIVLRSISKNRGSFTFNFARYEEAPFDTAKAIIDEKNKKMA